MFGENQDTPKPNGFMGKWALRAWIIVLAGGQTAFREKRTVTISPHVWLFRAIAQLLITVRIHVCTAVHKNTRVKLVHYDVCELESRVRAIALRLSTRWIDRRDTYASIICVDVNSPEPFWRLFKTHPPFPLPPVREPFVVVCLFGFFSVNFRFPRRVRSHVILLNGR